MINFDDKNRQLDLMAKLSAFFSHREKKSIVELAYLFGSRAEGEEGP